MIKATIQNSLYCTEIRFPCSETELSKKLGELGMNPEHLAPMATVIEIEPSELSMLEDFEVSLDALNYLGKRFDGMDELEYKQFLAVLSCPEISEGWGLKNIINLTDNLAHFTLIEATDDLEKVGLIHMLNVRGALTEFEYKNSEWLAAEGMKLLDSGKGIDTKYGKLFINEDIPFEENFNGTTFPAYYCEPNAFVMVEIGHGGLLEFVEMPCEDIAVKKALCRLGAENILDCKIEVDSSRDISDEWWEKICAVEKTRDIFGLNELLKTEDILLKQEQPVSIFNKEVARILRENDFTVSENSGCISVFSDGKEAAKIFGNGMISAPDNTSNDAYFEIKKIAGTVSEYCFAYEKAAPLKAEGLLEKYRCLAEFNSTVFAAKHTEYGFEFVTWDRTFDGKAVCQGNYFEDYAAAKENFATRSGLIDKDKLFGTEELEQLEKCVNFTIRHNGDLKFDDCEFLGKLSEKISENIPEQKQNIEPEMTM